MNTLRAIHRFGILRTRDLASLLWNKWERYAPQCEPNLMPPLATVSGIRMAQRTLARLKARNLVLCAKACDGSFVYALSTKGVRILLEIGIQAATGKDHIRRHSAGHFRHQCISTEIAISGVLEGFKIATEREIAQGRWLGGMNGIFGKKPDVVLRAGKKMYFVEVERSRKNQTDYKKLLAWLFAIWPNVMRSPEEHNSSFQNHIITKVIFICTKQFSDKIKSDLIVSGWSANQLEARLIFNMSLYKFEAITFF